jgi:acyl-CoA reductase-like NAD-dependent aldehyde dehydrogenase
MRPERHSLPITLIPGRAEVVYESKGAVLIVSPWNFPINLCLVPLVYAVAAGNSVALKPSELSPATADFLASLIAEVFPPEEVSVVLGGVDVAVGILDHPWNHIFFTGSPKIGSQVMAGAAKYLTSVTLELGGKSPVFVHPKFGPEAAGERVGWAKGLNAGQVCIAPDYALVRKDQRDAFIEGFKRGVIKHYSSSPASNPDFCKIVHPRHWDRLDAWFQEAVAGGAQYWHVDAPNRDTCYYPLTIVWDVPEHMDLVCHEIFGPILPVKTYIETVDGLASINAQSRPLVLYLLSHDEAWSNGVIAETPGGRYRRQRFLPALHAPHSAFWRREYLRHRKITRALGIPRIHQRPERLPPWPLVPHDAFGSSLHRLEAQADCGGGEVALSACGALEG